MKSSLKNLKDCRVKLSVEVEGARVEDRFREVLKDFQKAATLPGFRAGKAPMEMVEKKFAREAEEEVLKSLIPEAYHQSVAAQKVSPVSLPSISEVRLERGRQLTFVAEFERSPEFSVKNYKGIRLKRGSEEVSAQDMEKAMTSLLESKAELIPILEPRAVQKGDFIVADIEIWKDGAYAPAKKSALLHVEPSEQDDFYDKVAGARVDEVREILAGPARTPHYKIWIRDIKEKKLPVLDEELARGFGKASLEELREAVRKDTARYKRSESFEKMKTELFGKLLNLVSFTAPEGLVDRQKQELLEQTRKQFARMGVGQKFDEEKPELEKQALTRARDQVRLYFILRRIAQLEKIVLNEEELARRLDALAAESGRPLDEARRVFEEDLRESMLETKTIDFLIANAKFEEK
ncbi:MAG: trigger factor [Candidatus Omnitrophica bacterium]|nr:trigger factor [Candidatus Omnitrophota bacterium]